MAYSRYWQSASPGCIVILLDQSLSMEDPFGGSQIGANKRKADMVATVLNNLLNELITTNTNGEIVKPRADIAVIGYGGLGTTSALVGDLSSKSFVTLPELKNNPLRIETRMKKEMDDTGNIVETPTFFPLWIESVASGGTPMCAALIKAKALAEQWVQTHPDNYPPVIINITDGAATDDDYQLGFPNIKQVCSELRALSTSDGNALLFNCHITDSTNPEIAYPSMRSEVPVDKYNLAILLFELSSELPDGIRAKVLENTGESLASGARGFIFNGDANSVRNMFTFATAPAQQVIDPNS